MFLAGHEEGVGAGLLEQVELHPPGLTEPLPQGLRLLRVKLAAKENGYLSFASSGCWKLNGSNGVEAVSWAV